MSVWKPTGGAEIKLKLICWIDEEIKKDNISVLNLIWQHKYMKLSDGDIWHHTWMPLHYVTETLTLLDPRWIPLYWGVWKGFWLQGRKNQEAKEPMGNRGELERDWQVQITEKVTLLETKMISMDKGLAGAGENIKKNWSTYWRIRPWVQQLPGKNSREAPVCRLWTRANGALFRRLHMRSVPQWSTCLRGVICTCTVMEAV